jgi:hypothetical protein
MQSMPQATKVMKSHLLGPGDRIEAEGVCRNMVIEVVADDGVLVQSDEGVPGFRSHSEIEDVGKRKVGEDLDLQFVGKSKEGCIEGKAFADRGCGSGRASRL